MSGELQQWDVKWFDVIRVVIEDIDVQLKYVIVALIVILGVLTLVWGHKDHRTEKIIYLLAIPSPFLWYIVAQNHSIVHSWMTYRVMAISVFSVLLLETECIYASRRKTIR